MWICIASLLIPGIWNVAVCVDSIVLPSGSLAFISVSIITGAIVVVVCRARCIFVPESAIASMLVVVGFCGASI